MSLERYEQLIRDFTRTSRERLERMLTGPDKDENADG